MEKLENLAYLYDLRTYLTFFLLCFPSKSRFLMMYDCNTSWNAFVAPFRAFRPNALSASAGLKMRPVLIHSGLGTCKHIQ